MDIAIIKQDFKGRDVQAVDARELHAALGNKRQFADWVKHKVISSPFFAEGQDYILLHSSMKQNGRGGHNRVDYALSVDTAKKVAMAEQTDAGDKVRDYFLDCERKLISRSLPQTHAEALRAYADEVEKNARLEEQARLDRPKVEFAKAITASSGAISIGAFSRVLANSGHVIGQNKLFRWLRENGYLISYGSRRNYPYQKYVDQGLFVMREGTRTDHHGDEVVYVQTLITGKGQKHVAHEVTSEWMGVEGEN